MKGVVGSPGSITPTDPRATKKTPKENHSQRAKGLREIMISEGSSLSVLMGSRVASAITRECGLLSGVCVTQSREFVATGPSDVDPS